MSKRKTKREWRLDGLKAGYRAGKKVAIARVQRAAEKAAAREADRRVKAELRAQAAIARRKLAKAAREAAAKARREARAAASRAARERAKAQRAEEVRQRAAERKAARAAEREKRAAQAAANERRRERGRVRRGSAVARLTTRAKLAAELGPLVCQVCGASEAPASWGPDTGRRLRGAGLCWGCDFWRGVASVVVAAPTDPAWVIDGGRLFRVVYAPPVVRWTVTTRAGIFAASEVLEVGTVPDAWRAMLPDSGRLTPGGIGLSDILSALDRHAATPATEGRAGAG